MASTGILCERRSSCSEQQGQRTRGLSKRAEIDGNDALKNFAATLEKVCVSTVERGSMTKDLALLVGAQQSWLSTEGFLDKVNENLEAALSAQ